MTPTRLPHAILPLHGSGEHLEDSDEYREADNERSTPVDGGLTRVEGREPQQLPDTEHEEDRLCRHKAVGHLTVRHREGGREDVAERHPTPPVRSKAPTRDQ